MAKRNIGLLAVGISIALVGLVTALESQGDGLRAGLSNLTGQLKDLGSSGEPENNSEVANKIIKKVRALIDIDTKIKPTVATIVDVEVLRARNSFYDKAENGDHLVVTPTRAILYSSSENKIIDVVPITLEEAAGGSVEEGSSEE